MTAKFTPAQLQNTPRLETDRLILRAPQASDFAHFQPFLCSARAEFIGGGPDRDAAQAWRVLATITGHWHLRGFGTFVAEEKATRQPIGSIGPWEPHSWPEPELGWTIWSEAHEGKGFAAEAAIRTRAHAYDDLGWTTAVSYIDGANTRSIALAKRLGCWHDTNASGPHPDDLVYRHPGPEALK